MPISIPVPMPSPSACASHWWACSCWLSPRIIFWFSWLWALSAWVRPCFIPQHREWPRWHREARRVWHNPSSRWVAMERICNRTFACSHHHPVIRTACHLLVCPCSPACRHHHGKIGSLDKARLTYVVNHPQKQPLLNTHISKRVKYWALFILIMLVFSKYFYTACITSYFTFFLMDKFGVSVQTSQLCLFVFLAAFAIGTVAGGMLGDKFGRKY